MVAILVPMSDETIHLPHPREDILGSFLIDVPMEAIEIPDRITNFAIAAGFKQKSEYHVTLIGAKNAVLVDELEAKDEMLDIIYDIDTWDITPTSRYIFLAKADPEEGTIKESIIQMVAAPAVEEFYEKLKETRILELPLPPAHITLFTRFSDLGIGVYSQDDFDEYYIRQL